MSSMFANLAARHLGLTQHDISRIVRNAPQRYKVFTIPKRNGGLRLVEQPARELKDLQYMLMEVLLQNFPVHDAAKAYRPGTSIRNNAEVHARSSAILKMDFVDFFHSVKARDFHSHCATLGVKLSSEDKIFCQQVLFRRGKDGQLRLSIGAPSSPMISNTIVFEMDRLIAELCQRDGVSYSRYADDLTFSGNDTKALLSLRTQIPKLLAGLSYPKLYLNNEKTVLVSKKHRRSVTGIILTNDGSVSIGRDKKRKIRAAVHSYLQGKLQGDEVGILRGQLAYCKSVEPSYIARLERKYGQLNIKSLMSGPIKKG